MTTVPTDGATILLHSRTPTATGFLSSTQIRADTDGLKLPTDTISDLRNRNTPQEAKPDSYDAVAAYYTNLTFAAGIVVTNLSDMPQRRRSFRSLEQTLRARGWLEAYLPGYSKNGEVAVVRAAVGPWAHAAMLTALLEKTGGRWKVKWYYVARFA